MTLSYGAFCEDFAIENFLEIIIPQFIKYFKFHDINIEKSNAFSNKIKGVRFKKSFNRSFIKNEYPKYSQIALEYDNVDLFFAGFDADYNDKKRFEIEINNYYSNLKINIEKCIIFIPVQCIEHWLWYLKLNKESKNKKLL